MPYSIKHNALNMSFYSMNECDWLIVINNMLVNKLSLYLGGNE